jgi:hypothetical protein
MSQGSISPTLPQEIVWENGIRLRLTHESDGVVQGIRIEPSGKTMRFSTTVEVWLDLASQSLARTPQKSKG